MVLVSIVYDPRFRMLKLPDVVEVHTVIDMNERIVLTTRYAVYTNDGVLAVVLSRRYFEVMGIRTHDNDLTYMMMEGQIEKVKPELVEELRRLWGKKRKEKTR